MISHEALCQFVEPPPPELSKRGFIAGIPFYADVKIILPLSVAAVALFAAAVTLSLRWKNSECHIRSFCRLWTSILNYSNLFNLQDIRGTGYRGR